MQAGRALGGVVGGVVQAGRALGGVVDGVALGGVGAGAGSYPTDAVVPSQHLLPFEHARVYAIFVNVLYLYLWRGIQFFLPHLHC